MNMRSSLEMAIRHGDYDLAGMLDRIDLCFAAGALTPAEWQELTETARAGAQVQVEPGNEIPRLWAAIHSLQAQVASLSASGSEGTGDAAEEWPAFMQPTGAHDAYFSGSQVTYNGQHYRCIYDGACVWSPEVLPAAWELAVDE